MGGGWAGGLVMLVTMVLLWGGLITVGVLLVRRLGAPVERGRDAGRILDERLARGEIDAEEYQRRGELLRR